MALVDVIPQHILEKFESESIGDFDTLLVFGKSFASICEKGFVKHDYGDVIDLPIIDFDYLSEQYKSNDIELNKSTQLEF